MLEHDPSRQVVVASELQSAFKILKSAAFHRQYSWAFLFAKYFLIAAFPVAVVTGIVSAVATRNPGSQTLIEAQIWAVVDALSSNEVALVLLILVLLLVFDLSLSAARYCASQYRMLDDDCARQHGHYTNEIARRDQIILDDRAKARIDLLTSIPNELALHAEMSTRIRTGVVLIMIDLVNFGKFNTAFSHSTGNKVLTELAQYMFRHSRRVEHIYRMMENEKDGVREIEQDGWTFRLHRKGDEFLVVLEGGEMEALGFLNRLRREIASETSKISSAGGGDLLFYAGIFAVEAEIAPTECLHYADNALSMARQNADQGRVVWHSKTSNTDLRQRPNEKQRAFEFRRGLFREFETDPFWKGKDAKPKDKT